MSSHEPSKYELLCNHEACSCRMNCERFYKHHLQFSRMVDLMPEDGVCHSFKRRSTRPEESTCPGRGWA